MLASLRNDKRVSEQTEQKGKNSKLWQTKMSESKRTKQTERMNDEEKGSWIVWSQSQHTTVAGVGSFIYLRRYSFATLTQMANQIVDRQTFLEVMTLRLRPIKRNIAARKLWADGRFVFNLELLPALCSFESSNTHHFQSHYHHSIDGALNLTFNTKRHRFTYSTAVTLNIKYFIFSLRNQIIPIRW